MKVKESLQGNNSVLPYDGFPAAVLLLMQLS
jgi:hypothetical protein